MARPGYADYTRLVTSISPNVRECPPHVIWEQVRRSAIQVCKQAETWRFLHPSILLTEGVSRYEYQSPPDSRVGRVISASLVARLEQDDEDDQASPALLTPTTADALIQGRVAGAPRGWPAVDIPGAPRFILSPEPGSLMVVPTPDDEASYELSLYVVLLPLVSASGLPEAVLDELEVALYHRTLQDLHAQPGVPWASQRSRDYNASQYALHSYREHDNTATGGVQMVTPPRIA